MRRLFLLLLLSKSCFGLQEFYGISQSTRALGMGGAFYGLSDDEYALFYNPAGLGLTTALPRIKIFNIGLKTSSDGFNDLGLISTGISGDDPSVSLTSTESSQGRPLHAGVGLFPVFVQKGFAMGMLIADTKINYGILGAGSATELDATLISDTGIVMSRATKIGNWSLGFGLKVLYRAGGRQDLSATDIASGTKLDTGQLTAGGLGFDGDLGFSYEVHKPFFGNRSILSASINNVVGSNFPIRTSTTSVPPPLIRTANFGAFFGFLGTKGHEGLGFRIDLAEFAVGNPGDLDLGGRGGSVWKHLNCGLEGNLLPWLAIRGGLHQGNWTAGAGIHWGGLQVDFATYGEELASQPGRLTSRRFALQISLGTELGRQIPAPRVFGESSSPQGSPGITLSDASNKISHYSN